MARVDKARKAEPERIPSTDAVRRFGELLNRMLYRGEEFVITRHGRDVAALVLLPEAAERGGSPESVVA